MKIFKISNPTHRDTLSPTSSDLLSISKQHHQLRKKIFLVPEIMGWGHLSFKSQQFLSFLLCSSRQDLMQLRQTCVAKDNIELLTLLNHFSKF